MIYIRSREFRYEDGGNFVICAWEMQILLLDAYSECEERGFWATTVVGTSRQAFYIRGKSLNHSIYKSSKSRD